MWASEGAWVSWNTAWTYNHGYEGSIQDDPKDVQEVEFCVGARPQIMIVIVVADLVSQDNGLVTQAQHFVTTSPT